MRPAGVLLIVIAFLSYALLTLRDKHAAIRSLRDVSAALELLYGELEMHETPLPEAIARSVRYSRGDGKNLFQNLTVLLLRLGEESFADLWSKAVSQSCRQLPASALDELARLGLSLGRYELSTQLREMRGCIALLCRTREEGERSFPSERRLWLGLCAAAGCFLAILMI